MKCEFILDIIVNFKDLICKHKLANKSQANKIDQSQHIEKICKPSQKKKT